MTHLHLPSNLQLAIIYHLQSTINTCSLSKTICFHTVFHVSTSMPIAINCTGAHRGLCGRCILQHGTAAWNGSVERQRGVRQAAAQSMLQNAAGSDLSTGSVERQRGTAAWSAPTAALHAAVPCCRMQRGLTSALAAWNGSVERPRGVRQQPHPTRPFHAAECRGV